VQKSFVGGVEKETLVGGVDKFNTVHEDSVVEPTLHPTRAWISGRDPLLVVSIVTAQKNPPLLDLFVFFLLCIMHLSPLHVLSNKIIFSKAYFVLLV
jgi:hypothetical protein